MSSSRMRLAKDLYFALRLKSLRAPRIYSAARSYATPAPYKAQEKDPQLGDYPELPWISAQELPARGWWDEQMRRDFGDPIHEYDEVLSMWGPDVPVVPAQRALLHFSLATLGFIGFGTLCNYILVAERPTVPREYPYSGLIKELGGLEENQAKAEGNESDEE